MTIDTSLSREDLRRQLSQGRVYVWPPNDPNARRYRSVTNALDAIPKPGLTRWAAKLTAETAVEKLDILNQLVADDPKAATDWLKGSPFTSRDRAADIGGSIHSIVELDALGQSQDADTLVAELPTPSARRKADQARAFFRQVPGMVIDHVEFVVYHHGLGYAGTGDFIITLPAGLISLPGIDVSKPSTWIVDLKTGKGVYPEHALQLSAYRFAENMVDLRTGEMLDMPPTVGGLVLHVDEDGWEIIPLDTSEPTFAKFRTALGMADELPLDNSMVGTPVMRGKA